MSLNMAKKIGDSMGVDWSKYSLRQFAKGLHHEYKKGLDRSVTYEARIVLDHLNESSEYYK